MKRTDISDVKPEVADKPAEGATTKVVVEGKSIDDEAKDQASLDKATAKAAEPAKHPKPKTYTSTSPVYVESTYFKPGEPFTTAAKKGAGWTEIDVETRAAIVASDKLRHEDVNYEAMDVSALLAAAAADKIAIPEGVTDKDAIIAIIKAADEPAL